MVKFDNNSNNNNKYIIDAGGILNKCRCSLKNGDTVSILFAGVGGQGELVFTTITKEAMPLIRYRIKDISFFYEDNCPCGKKLIKMARPMGRTDDMLIIRGVNVFPSQIKEVLMKVKDLEPHYLISYSSYKGKLYG